MSRIRVPELVKGPYTGLIIGTFGANLPFAETAVLRQLAGSGA